MKHLLRAVPGLLFVSSTMMAQDIHLSPQYLQFDTVAANQRDSLSFFVVNESGVPLTVTDINTNRPVFTVLDTAFTVPPDDSVSVKVYFQTNQNVTWADVISVENSGAHGALPLRVRGTARYSEPLYAPTQGLWENDLKSALFNLVNNQTVLGYNASRDRMFETVDDPAGNDTIECVYTGRRIHAATRTEAQNQGFNTEHSWPQSNFNGQDPMVSDINHLFPTDSPPNSARSNYPFGPVVSNITWQSGGSKLGHNPAGQIVFEPRDSHKGDVARVMFYFLLRYPVNYGSFMDATQESALRQWYATDPVSQKEVLRNNAIAVYQGKRNPLVDHPEFVDRITYFRTSTLPPQNPHIVVTPREINFGTVAVGDSSGWSVLIMNSGRASLAIPGVTFQSPTTVFLVSSYATAVAPDSFQTVSIRFKPQLPHDTSSNVLVIQSSDPDESTVNIPLSGSSVAGSSYQYAVNDGWNLVSVPLTVGDYRTSIVFAAASSPAFAFEQPSGYVRRDTLANGAGYWLKFPSSQNVSMAGTIRTRDTVHVNAGWNLIGSIGNPVARDSVMQIPPGIVGSNYFGYTGSYAAADTLQPGKGYWVKATQDGRLVLR